jgi:hypothetical protein
MLGKNSFHGPLGGCFKMVLAADALHKKLRSFFLLSDGERKQNMLWKLEMAQGNSLIVF